MKIVCAIFRYFPYGGLQRDMLAIVRELATRGHQIVVACGAWEAPPPEEPNITLKILPTHGFTNHGKAKSFIAAFQKYLPSIGADLVVAFNRMPNSDIYYAADNPFITMARRKHGFLRKFLPRYRFFERMEREIFSPQSFTEIFCLIESQKQAFQAEYGTPDQRFFIMPPHVDKGRRRPENLVAVRSEIRRELGIGDTEQVLIQVAASFRTKGVDRAIEAFAALPSSVLSNARLVVVGGDNSAPYRRIAKRLGVSDKVIFVGARADVPNLLVAADLMVHPARNEATGTVLLESLVMGTPAVCSAICGYSNFVLDSGGAVLPEPFITSELARVLASILSSPDTLDKMKRAAMNYDCSGFYHRAEVAANKIEEVAREKF